MEADGRSERALFSEYARETRYLQFHKACGTQPAEKVLHADLTVGYIAEMMKSEAKHKFSKAEF